MRANARIVARRQIDNRLKDLQIAELDRPSRGWVKAIREALGMTMAQLARRLDVVTSRVAAIEAAEVSGGLTLKSLEEAARALDCRLVYFLVPRKPLAEIVSERAEQLARHRLRTVRYHMALENQAVDRIEDDAQFTELVKSLIERSGSELWNDPDDPSDR